jgi:uncharacterized protein (DUF1786 family)
MLAALQDHGHCPYVSDRGLSFTVAHTARWLRGFVEDCSVLERDIISFGQSSQTFLRNVLLSSSVAEPVYLSALRLKLQETVP